MLIILMFQIRLKKQFILFKRFNTFIMIRFYSISNYFVLYVISFILLTLESIVTFLI